MRVAEKSKSNLGINSFGGATDRFGQNAKDSVDNVRTFLEEIEGIIGFL